MAGGLEVSAAAGAASLLWAPLLRGTSAARCQPYAPLHPLRASPLPRTNSPASQAGWWR